MATPITMTVERTIDPPAPRRLFVGPTTVRPSMEEFEPSDPAMRVRAFVGDYALIHHDGYRSVCPKRAFEAGYSQQEES